METDSHKPPTAESRESGSSETLSGRSQSQHSSPSKQPLPSPPRRAEHTSNLRTPQKNAEQVLYEDVEEFDHEQYLQSIRDKWNPMLVDGAKTGDVERIKLALKNGAQVTQKDRRGWDPLCWASCQGDLRVVEVLLEKGAADDPGCGYLAANARGKAAPQIVRGSLVENAEVNPLQLATVRGHQRVAALLMKHSFDADCIDQFGNSVLHLAAASNDFDTFAVFLQLGADLEKFNCRGHTPRDVSTHARIRKAIDQWRAADKCSITGNVFRRHERKFWCAVCKRFFHENGCQVTWQNYELDSTEPFRPECLCVDCSKWRDAKVEELRRTAERKDSDVLAKLTAQAHDERVPLTVETRQWLDYQNAKLQAQKRIQARLGELTRVEDYKTIKKAVFELQRMVPDTVVLDADVLERVAEQAKRLNSERNLRFFLDEFGSMLESPGENPRQRAHRLRQDRLRRAQKAKKRRRRPAPPKKPGQARRDKRTKDSKPERQKPDDPSEVLKHLRFDITIEDVERYESAPAPVRIADLQPLISQLDMYLTVAEANGVATEYVQAGRSLKSQFQKRIRLEALAQQFDQYPHREYPPDPVWDARGKRWLHGETLKPLDPKKPVVLPLHPPKKGKKRRKQKDFSFPDWAQDRKAFVQRIHELEALLEDEHVTLGGDARLAGILASIARMHKENKFRVRVEKDRKLIEEFHAKSRKDRTKAKF